MVGVMAQEEALTAGIFGISLINTLNNSSSSKTTWHSRRIYSKYFDNQQLT